MAIIVWCKTGTVDRVAYPGKTWYQSGQPANLPDPLAATHLHKHYALAPNKDEFHLWQASENLTESAQLGKVIQLRCLIKENVKAGKSSGFCFGCALLMQLRSKPCHEGAKISVKPGECDFCAARQDLQGLDIDQGFLSDTDSAYVSTSTPSVGNLQLTLDPKILSTFEQIIRTSEARLTEKINIMQSAIMTRLDDIEKKKLNALCIRCANLSPGAYQRMPLRSLPPGSHHGRTSPSSSRPNYPLYNSMLTVPQADQFYKRLENVSVTTPPGAPHTTDEITPLPNFKRNVPEFRSFSSKRQPSPESAAVWANIKSSLKLVEPVVIKDKRDPSGEIILIGGDNRYTMKLSTYGRILRGLPKQDFIAQKFAMKLLSQWDVEEFTDTLLEAIGRQGELQFENAPVIMVDKFVDIKQLVSDYITAIKQ